MLATPCQKKLGVRLPIRSEGRWTELNSSCTLHQCPSGPGIDNIDWHRLQAKDAFSERKCPDIKEVMEPKAFEGHCISNLSWYWYVEFWVMIVNLPWIWFPSPHSTKDCTVWAIHSNAQAISVSVLSKDAETRYTRQAVTGNSYPKGV